MNTNPFAYLLKPYNERELQISVKMALYKYEVDSELLKANTRLEQEVKINIETEQNLRESEERFRQLAENIKDVFWIADKQLKEFIYISPNYDLLWKHDRETLYNDPKGWLSSVADFTPAPQ